MQHPLLLGTRIIVLMPGCQPCGGKDQRVDTSVREVDNVNGVFVYTILDGRKVTEENILQVI